MPELPSELVEALHRARALEAAAAGLHQRRAAIAGTSALMLAAVEAGWRCTDLSRAAGLNDQAGQKRVRAARARGAGGGLDVEQRPQRPPTARGVLAQPVEDRQWLSTREAAEYTGHSVDTIGSWRRHGLLPNTDRRETHYLLHLRADLDRVLSAPTGRAVALTTTRYGTTSPGQRSDKGSLSARGTVGIDIGQAA